MLTFFNKIDNDELFILFALGIVFLTSGIASVMNVTPIIVAFFVGMILAESKVTLRVQAAVGCNGLGGQILLSHGLHIAGP